ncbi:UNVERIFIED_ORG: nucleotide sugar dehydratase [Lacrimispora saccharolytica]
MKKPWIPMELLKESSIFITGASGLIGSVMAEYLLKINESCRLGLHLLLLVRNKNKLPLEILREEEKGTIEIIEGDVCKIPEIKGAIDYIVHGASITESRMMVEKPVEVIRTNLEGTLNCLELARKKNIKSMIYLSTMEVYGFTEEEMLLTEEKVQYLNPLVLRSSYPESKRMAENLCVSYAKEYGVPARIIRLAQTFGHGVKENDTRVFAEFARCAKKGQDICLKTDGMSKRMYLDTGDAARAVLTVLLKGKAGEAYNAGNKETYCSVREMAEMVASKIADGRISVQFASDENSRKQFSPPHRLLLDVSRLEALGWEATAGLKEMYLEMMEDWKGKK